MTTIPSSLAQPRVFTPSARDVVIGVLAAAIALLALYAVFLDQGALLSPLLGHASWDQNFLHEFAHDGRHLGGAPCH